MTGDNYHRNDYDRRIFANEVLVDAMITQRKMLLIERIRHRLLASISDSVTAVAFHLDDRMLAVDHAVGGDIEAMIFDLDDRWVTVAADDVFDGWSARLDEVGRLVVQMP